MQQALKIIQTFNNKYFIASAAFIVLLLFFDHNNIFMQLQHRKELHAMLESKAFYKQQIAETKKNLNELQNNSAALEKYAREKFLLKRDNEDLFIVPAENTQKK